MLEYITDDIELSSDDSNKKILMKKILTNKILKKKIKYRKNYSKMRLGFIILMSSRICTYILQKSSYYLQSNLCHFK